MALPTSSLRKLEPPEENFCEPPQPHPPICLPFCLQQRLLLQFPMPLAKVSGFASSPDGVLSCLFKYRALLFPCSVGFTFYTGSFPSVQKHAVIIAPIWVQTLF